MIIYRRDPIMSTKLYSADSEGNLWPRGQHLLRGQATQTSRTAISWTHAHLDERAHKVKRTVAGGEIQVPEAAGGRRTRHRTPRSSGRERRPRRGKDWITWPALTGSQLEGQGESKNPSWRQRGRGKGRDKASATTFSEPGT